MPIRFNPNMVTEKKSLPPEGKVYVQQLDKQVNQIYNPDTDGKIYNPATDGRTIYRNTHNAEPKNALPLQEQINRYGKRKTLQAILFISVFFIGFIFLGCLHLEMHYIVDRNYIAVHFWTWWFLFRGVSSSISIVLLYYGDKNEDKKLLKAFLIVGRLSYSIVDCRVGGFDLVRRRILEIGSKQAGIPATNSHYSNAVAAV